jgi:hypothetical protein
MNFELWDELAFEESMKGRGYCLSECKSYESDYFYVARGKQRTSVSVNDTDVTVYLEGSCDIDNDEDCFKALLLDYSLSDLLNLFKQEWVTQGVSIGRSQIRSELKRLILD